MLVVGGLSVFLALIGYILTFWRRLSILVGVSNLVQAHTV
jgi:hypothetical protein